MQCFFSSIFLLTREVFENFSYSKVIKLTQSRNLVYLILIFEMYSLVIKIAILVNKAALDDITIPTDGLIIDKVKLVIVEPPRIKFQRSSSIPFFYLNFYTSSYNIIFIINFK